MLPGRTGTILLLLDIAGFLFTRQGTQRFGALKRPMDANSSCSFVLKVKTVPQSWQVIRLSV
jgi:hypothetical protein